MEEATTSAERAEELKSDKWCTITKAVSYHIAKDMVPVATVEQVGFKKLLKTMDPRYELPSHNYFAQEALPQMYTEVRQSLADRLANLEEKETYLAEVQIQLGLPSHQLITESATHWGSRQQMIERVLEQEEALAKVLSNDKKTRHLVPTWQDLEVLEAVQKVLKPLQDFTDALSEGDNELCKSIKTSIVEYLNSKYSHQATTDLLEMASFVDPRFRGAYIPSEKVDALKHRAVLEVETLLADQSSCQPPYLRVPEPADGEAAVAPKAKRLASFFKQRTATTTAPTKREAIENELSSYLQSASVESDTDPLKWWKDHEVFFPSLSHLAKLSVPATSSPSERVFSCSGNIVTCQRASLKPDAIDRLVFLAQNL
ncbi:unnamed protein product [Leuciscus chuanchicus]